MKQFKLLSNIEDDVKNPKTKYQVFDISIDSSKIEVMIKFDQADLFEKKFNASKFLSKNEIISFIQNFPGEIVND